MGLRPTEGDEKRLVPATTLYGIVTLSLSSRPERSGAEGPAVPRTLRGDVFRPERSEVERSAVSFSRFIKALPVRFRQTSSR
jgi:hypothetical protein